MNAPALTPPSPARIAATLSVALVLGGCATAPGPRTVLITGPEIEREVGIELGRTLEAFRGLDVRRPEVGFMPNAERVQLAWAVWLPAPSADNLLLSSVSLTVAISGKPALDAAKARIELTEVRVEDIRVGGLSRFLGPAVAPLPGRVGAQLPDLPLMPIAPELLRIRNVAYEARSVSVGFAGLRLEIAPK